MFISTSSAFGLVLDLMALVFVAVITFTFLLLEGDIMGGQVGLAITQAMSLTGMLQWGIRQSAEVSNQLMSVERILEYRDLEPELAPQQPKTLTSNWPPNGKIEFRSVVYKYFAGSEPVLKGLSFVVKPKEKIGIVGRTGAGKSSLISAIFRLAVVEGEILIDDVNSADISLDRLRTKISIIPQDPVLFSGTLRRYQKTSYYLRFGKEIDNKLFILGIWIHSRNIRMITFGKHLAKWNSKTLPVGHWAFKVRLCQVAVITVSDSVS